MPKIDRTGERIGKIVVVKDSGQRYRTEVIWEVECDCGKRKHMRSSSLKKSRSCGCQGGSHLKADYECLWGIDDENQNTRL